MVMFCQAMRAARPRLAARPWYSTVAQPSSMSLVLEQPLKQPLRPAHRVIHTVCKPKMVRRSLGVSKRTSTSTSTPPAAPSLRQRWERLYDAWPYTMAGLIVGTKAVGSDLTAQIYEQAGNESFEMDVVRNMKFTAFCFFYVGSFQHWVYNVVFPRLIPGTGLLVALKMSLLDNGFYSPFVYMPAYYSTKAMFAGQSPVEGLKEYRENGAEVLKALYSVWIPAQFINFLLMPPQYKIMYITVVGFFWEVILSHLAPMVEEAPEAAPKPESEESET